MRLPIAAAGRAGLMTLAVSVLVPVKAAEPSTALRSALMARYPQVVRWEIQPMDGRDQAVSGVVVRMGRRSLVRLPDGSSQWSTVSGMAAAWVATRSLSARQAVQPGQLRSQQVDIMSLGCDPLLQVAGERQLRTTRSVVAGAALCTSDVEPVPVVRRGQLVTLRASSAGVVVATEGVAQADGEIGDRVRVRNPMGQMVSGVVSGEAEVRVNGHP